VWSDSQRSVSPAFTDNEQAERILSLILRLQNGIVRTLLDSPTRFKPLLYRPEEGESRQRDARSAKGEAGPPEASAWCEGYMAGVLLREELWEPIYANGTTRDWMLPVEALAYGDHDPEYLDWVDTPEKRLGMVDELPIAAVLIFRFWHEQARVEPNRAERRAQRREAARKSRQRLH
jgi:yecA family protein